MYEGDSEGERARRRGERDLRNEIKIWMSKGLFQELSCVARISCFYLDEYLALAKRNYANIAQEVLSDKR